MKKMIAAALALALLIGFAACGAKSIGEISGAENEYITIGDVTYVLDSDHHFSYADKGEYLGEVSNGKTTMKVYSVKGDTEGDYLYALWDWEGSFYQKQD